MKIVIDTNVVLSSLLSQHGASNRLMVWLFLQEERYAVLSNTLLVEYEDVLLRHENIKQYNDLSYDNVNRFIDDICLISYHQEINFLWRPFLKDSNDDMVLEVAFNANAKYIITFNPKDFGGVEENFDIQIITPQKFLSIIGAPK